MGQLKDHLISHTEFRPFQCPYCKKYYRRKEILKNHFIIHSKEKYFKDNQGKFKEMINEVKKMKHLKYNLENIIKLPSNTLIKDEKQRKHFFILKSNKRNNLNLGEENKNNLNENIQNENIIEYKEKINLNKNDDIINEENIENDYSNIPKNEMNNLLSSTDDISIKEDNNDEKNNFYFERNNFDFEKSQNYLNNANKNLNYWRLNYYNNNIENINNKYENDEYSNLMNLYFNDFKDKKDIDAF